MSFSFRKSEGILHSKKKKSKKSQACTSKQQGHGLFLLCSEKWHSPPRERRSVRSERLGWVSRGPVGGRSTRRIRGETGKRCRGGWFDGGFVVTSNHGEGGENQIRRSPARFVGKDLDPDRDNQMTNRPPFLPGERASPSFLEDPKARGLM